MAENFSEVLHYYPASYGLNHPNTSGAASQYLCEVEDEDDVKRPMNSFLLWAKIMRRKYASENPHLHNAEISKLLGKIWNSMSTSDKRPYVERAEKLRVVHMRTYPNYRYAPKKRRDKKSHRTISPEVAAALHSSFFDVKNILSGQLSQARPFAGDLKSFGYLRNACENTKNPDDAVYPFNEQEETERECTQATQYFVKKDLRRNSSNKTLESAMTSQHIYQGKTEQRKNIERMTFHYYPVSNSHESVDFYKTIETNFQTTPLNEQDTPLPQNFRFLEDELAMLTNMDSSDLNTNTLETFREDAIELQYSPPLCVKDNNSKRTLDEELPEFLQQLIDSPLHLSRDETRDTSTLWADIADIIGSGDESVTSS
uniref:Sex-determining region Y protein n=1 Tax=Hydractinia echinata TaxID=3283270 RepID=A0A1P8L003_HYDEC|nr:SoxF2 [Hydractinia echinata]